MTTVLHLSDIHFRQEYPAGQGQAYLEMVRRMRNPLEKLAHLLREVQQKTTLDVVLVTGDLTEDGTAADYRFLKAWLKQRIGKAELLVTLGNHDAKAAFRAGWLGEEAQNQPYNWVREFADFTMLGFDNSIQGQNNGSVTAEQFQWLTRTLDGLAGKPIVLATHHHLIETQYNVAPLPEREQLADLLGHYEVRAILTGHTHQSFMTEWWGMPYYTAPGLSFIGIEEPGGPSVRFEERSGYHLYQIDKGYIYEVQTKILMASDILAQIAVDAL